MGITRKAIRAAGAASVAVLALSAPAYAENFTWSFTAGGTTDYVFRGISQTSEDPMLQGSVDVGYGIFYAGVWASGLDFGGEEGVVFDGGDANTEIDFYAGIKPVWGPATFDFGVIYYAYPSASDNDLELDYVELKAGYSIANPWIKNLTTGTTVFWSPDYTNEQDNVITVESVAAYALPAVGVFTPTISGTWGAVFGDADDGFFAANGDDDYQYWNAGISVAVEKITFDFRYWDTNIQNFAGQTDCNSAGVLNTFQCDERFVFSAKVTLP
jgi:uncharacterized protein (TIGR02001 family)